MEESKYQILKDVESINDLTLLVSILELTSNKTGVLTISEMARKEGKSPNGIRGSKKYGKIIIGGQTMCYVCKMIR